MEVPATDPIAYLNGEYIPFTEAKLPVFDLGLMQGATVTERLRTVRHHPYQVFEHLQRLSESLSSTGIHMPTDGGPLEGIIADVVRYNVQGLSPDEDVAVVIFVTAGQGLGDSNGLVSRSRPTVCVYTAPLPWKQWKHWYEQGVSLEVPRVRQVPAGSLSPRIKHRSRLHWYLADQAAKETDPFAQALLLDSQGFVTETSSGNLFVVREHRLQTPRPETTLPGIAQAYVSELARSRGWTVERCDLTWEEVATAEEAFLTSSTYCIAPVGRIQGRTIGTSLPGPVTQMLTDAWSAELGLSLPAQVSQCSATHT